MRDKIFGGIGILWGGAIVGRWLLVGIEAKGSSAYQAGQGGAVIFGLGLLLAGLYYFFKKPKTPKPPS